MLNRTPSFVPRTWIDIDLDAVKANYRTARSLTEAVVTCVLKANAYGHGAVRIAHALAEEGCQSFAVSCAREALELRHAGVTGEILNMGLTETICLPACIRHHITLTAASVEELVRIDEAAASACETAHVHLKLDTGFHRLGFACSQEEAGQIAAVVRELTHTRVEGLYSHLGLVNQALDEAQHECLVGMHHWLADAGLMIHDLHLCDSIGLVRYPQWNYSRVRVGAMLFGVRPSRTDDIPFQCLETLAFRTSVAQLHAVEKGGIVGYGDDMPLTRDSVIATLCAGYGDGYPRSLSNASGKVLIHGKLCPVVGIICMDQVMVDVTDVPDVQPGDTATLLGGGIDYMTYSNWCHTNRNECLTILSRRPVRVYHEHGKIIAVEDHLIPASDL